MIARLKQLLAKIRFRRPFRADSMSDVKRPVENIDAVAGADANFPPNYVPPADEGRPRH